MDFKKKSSVVWFSVSLLALLSFTVLGSVVSVVTLKTALAAIVNSETIYSYYQCVYNLCFVQLHFSYLLSCGSLCLVQKPEEQIVTVPYTFVCFCFGMGGGGVFLFHVQWCCTHATVLTCKLNQSNTEDLVARLKCFRA